MARGGYRWVQKDRQVDLRLLGAMRPVLQGKPEKARKADGFDIRALAFKRAAEHF